MPLTIHILKRLRGLGTIEAKVRCGLLDARRKRDRTDKVDLMRDAKRATRHRF
jgi:hypothetical protein